MLADLSHPEDFVISFYGLARFEIAFSAKTIRVSSKDHATEGTIRHLLADHVVPRVIAHEGHNVLHAGAVITPGRAIIITGPSGSGKSTLAAALHAAGYPLLGDDAMIAWQEEGIMKCQSVYRSLRLFPDSLSFVLDTIHELSPVAQYTRKLNVHLDEAKHADGAFPVRAVLYLQPVIGVRTRIRRMRAADLCMKLTEHSFWMDPEDLQQARQRLQRVSELATNVPAFEVNYRHNFSQLQNLCEAIIDNVNLMSPMALEED